MPFDACGREGLIKIGRGQEVQQLSSGVCVRGGTYGEVEVDVEQNQDEIVPPKKSMTKSGTKIRKRSGKSTPV
ncbi:MAG: hypothetical protein E5Y58_16160 [Mesorhizobium sp.]|nr:MAG: hypothetical protein E5Y58_16160 [Mesorhizobium sp.]